MGNKVQRNQTNESIRNFFTNKIFPLFENIKLPKLKVFFCITFTILLLEVIFLTYEIPYSTNTLLSYDSVRTKMYFTFTIMHYLFLLIFGFFLFVVDDKLNASIFFLLFTSVFYFIFTCAILDKSRRIKGKDERSKKKKSVIETFLAFHFFFSMFFSALFIYLFFYYFKFEFHIKSDNVLNLY